MSHVAQGGPSRPPPGSSNCHNRPQLPASTQVKPPHPYIHQEKQMIRSLGEIYAQEYNTHITLRLSILLTLVIKMELGFAPSLTLARDQKHV